MRVDKPKLEPLDLVELTRQLEEAQAEALAAQTRARLLRTQIQAEERRQRRSRSVWSSTGLGGTVSVGIFAGVAAGMSFALFVTVMNAIYGDGFLDWLRYSAAIALGTSALPDSSPLFVVIVGLIVHLSLAALYGAIFAVAARYVRILRRDLIIATAVFGLAIWIVNFYVFSPLLFPWFSDSPGIVQFIAHTIFYGIPLGLILLEFTPSSGTLADNRLRA